MARNLQNVFDSALTRKLQTLATRANLVDMAEKSATRALRAAALDSWNGAKGVKLAAASILSATFDETETEIGEINAE